MEFPLHFSTILIYLVLELPGAGVFIPPSTDCNTQVNSVSAGESGLAGEEEGSLASLTVTLYAM